jgi:hypothetical protein
MRFISVVLCIGFSATACFSGEAPQQDHADPKKAFVLDKFTPPPQIVARADSLQSLIGATKPTAIWSSDWLWVKTGANGTLALTVGSPQWVRFAQGLPFWALLRHGRAGEIERDRDGLVTAEIHDRVVRDLQFVSEKTISDSGSGDYARILQRRGEWDLYEIGIQCDSFGSGHDVVQRRLFAARGPNNRWQFIGEGPSECSGKSGMECEAFTSDARAKLTGDLKAPATIEFSTTEWNMMAQESAQPHYPDLEIHREALLDGLPPDRLQWLTDSYLVAGPHDTLDEISNRYIYWQIEYAVQGIAEADRQEAARFKKMVRDRNPALGDGTLPQGAIVYFPTQQEIQADGK